VAELLLPPFTPLYPNNSVRIEPTSVDRLRDLVPDAYIALRFEGLRLGLPALRASFPVPRAELALTAMAVHASRYPAGLQYGYHSFLSHVEEFLLTCNPSVRSSLDKVWTANAASAVALVSRVAWGHPTNAAEAAWQTWTIAMRLAAEASYDAGLLEPGRNLRHSARAFEIGDMGAIRRHDPSARTEFSEYHTALWSVDLSQPEIERNMTVYRCGTNVLYQLLAILDVTPLERYAAGYVLARAAQEILGTTWSEQFAALPKAG
jgi:hypothetical protein